MILTHGKRGIRVGEYGPTEGNMSGNDGNGIVAFLEPNCKNPQWILWLTEKGDGILYTKRSYKNGDTGAVVGEPIRFNAAQGLLSGDPALSASPALPAFKPVKSAPIRAASKELFKVTAHGSGREIKVECPACYDEEGSEACIRLAHPAYHRNR